MQKISNKNQLRRHFLRKKSWFPSAKSASCIALLPWHERLIINCPFRPHVIPWSMIAIDSGFILLRPGGYLHHLKHTQAHINDSKPVFIRCYAKCQFGSIASLLTKIGNASKIGDQNCWDAGTIHDFHEVCALKNLQVPSSDKFALGKLWVVLLLEMRIVNLKHHHHHHHQTSLPIFIFHSSFFGGRIGSSMFFQSPTMGCPDGLQTLWCIVYMSSFSSGSPFIVAT